MNIKAGKETLAKLCKPINISALMNTLLGCPSIPILWSIKNKVLTASIAQKSIREISTLLKLIPLIELRNIIYKMTDAIAAAIDNTKWKWPTTK